jgi:hypothetical protein
MIPDICRVYWFDNHAFTCRRVRGWFCACERLGDCSMSHSKLGHAKTTSARSTLLRVLNSNPDVIGSSPSAVTYTLSTSDKTFTAVHEATLSTGDMWIQLFVCMHCWTHTPMSLSCLILGTGVWGIIWVDILIQSTANWENISPSLEGLFHKSMMNLPNVILGCTRMV